MMVKYQAVQASIARWRLRASIDANTACRRQLDRPRVDNLEMLVKYHAVLALQLHDTELRREHVTPTRLVVAGWTGRDGAAVAHHVAELKELGVRPPSRTPIFYMASPSRVTCAPRIEVLGSQTSGEAEFLLLQHGRTLWVGIGSDHTDRALETYGVAASKQICDKLIGSEFWRYDAVAAHWDQLRLRAYATISGKRELYQDGTVAEMLPPNKLISLYDNADKLPEGTLMFCGTLAAIGGVRPADRFECELEDPVLGRRIACGYDITALPILS
jgi:Protein of unknown function (DUF2848)